MEGRVKPPLAWLTRVAICVSRSSLSLSLLSISCVRTPWYTYTAEGLKRVPVINVVIMSTATAVDSTPDL
jgi:hypothetical protein